MSTLRDRAVDVLGKKYKVRFLKECRLEEPEFGEVDFDKMEILINSEKGEDHQRDTVVHELLHTISYDMKLNLSEKQVRSLACAIYQVFKSNVSLRKWLFGGGSRIRFGT